MCVGTHPFIPVPNVARVRMVYSSNGQQVMNVFHFRKTGGYTAADLAALNTAVHTAWTAHLKPVQPVPLALEFLEATALDSASAPQDTQLVNGAGSESTTLAPNNVTWAIKFSTGATGRSRRGRMYFIGLSPDDVGGNLVLPASVTSKLAAVVAFFAQVLSLSSSVQVIVSYCHAGAWLTTGVANDVTSILATDANIDSQRRRLTGRGM